MVSSEEHVERSFPVPPELGEADVLAVVRVLGTEEIRFVGSLTAPFLWITSTPDGSETARNGSVFFLDAGCGPFAVTAAHVVKACLADSRSPTFVQSMIGLEHGPAYPFSLAERIIAIHDEIDLATLRFSRDEIRLIGRTVLTGFQRSWPPRVAKADGFVTYAGWPGAARHWLGPKTLQFGMTALAGQITSADDACISVQILREQLEQVLGDKEMPEDYDFGGMSGGPALEIVHRAGIRGWILAGVIFQGPNPSGDRTQSISGLEIIRIRPAHFINADGTLDIVRWEQCRPLG